MTNDISLGELLRQGTEIFRNTLVPQPQQTASLLVRALLKLDLATLIAHPERPVAEADAERVRAAFDRRADGEPAQYIIGVQEFYGLEFKVTPDVLIPRPETEFLVEIAVEFCRERNLAAPRILDVGTGSGCIAISIAHTLPQAQVWACDISPGALAVAQENALRNGVAERLKFVESDYLSAFLGNASEFSASDRLDVIVSNPPYVAEHELSGLQREVRDFEPVTSLVGGPEGIEGYVKLLETAPAILAPQGIFACEVGFTQAERISHIAQTLGWTCLKMTDDLQGIPRILTFKRAEDFNQD